MPAYVSALTDGIRMWAEALGPETRVETVFFGGGTPSLLPPGDVGRILDACRDGFSLAEDVEITLESNPDDFNATLLGSLREAGVNRLSIGVQSFNDRRLAALTRRHSAPRPSSRRCSRPGRRV